MDCQERVGGWGGGAFQLLRNGTGKDGEAADYREGMKGCVEYKERVN